ncbi:hypothetical protein PHSY_004602 [Pseudozyma hubeiensis SY62]|uniref:Uncharacterized protein n=1 Tax=Pseudozyma hubeiensis (strain SY62) TaxID=1305764 RepID=R9P6H8_PSEHS|nr:hypothetical protein PHSY_004602 [Pseudozyma hubeiensis SY62]GAC97018.1 hypothetical protein PHSY_004602 [Pseudozyma hubeiensis SY62]
MESLSMCLCHGVRMRWVSATMSRAMWMEMVVRVEGRNVGLLSTLMSAHGDGRTRRSSLVHDTLTSYVGPQFDSADAKRSA